MPAQPDVRAAVGIEAVNPLPTNEQGLIAMAAELVRMGAEPKPAAAPCAQCKPGDPCWFCRPFVPDGRR